MITHERDQISFTLHADGGLAMEDAEGQRVELSAEAVRDLALFLQLPGIRPQINRAALDRQRGNGEEDEV